MVRTHSYGFAGFSLTINRSVLRAYGYLLFALIALVMIWESNKEMQALLNPVIPEESIRLRILAQSDAPRDQWIKGKIRDAIVASLAASASEPQTLEEARAAIGGRLAELEAMANEMLRANGFEYTAHVELGVVPFPAKMYGHVVYPAGEYEALRVTLGDGLGQNWWCVLFPPLCFVDGTTGEASAKTEGTMKTGKAEAKSSGKEGAVSAKSAAPAADDDAGDARQEQADQPEVKFFLWELIKKLIAFLKGLFS
ncbi:stage II sporulation protein R [Paenibacillus thermoaerophilus]|uniref:Stage II sporulation protein R n=1 Tax=Paenibacillus thermoaerophilus TaxID=1215385 RepID=A0ABW2V4T0_9BACL|nr:stage II sporulation protein R [Paenibacillus thermoaerophilus]TMV12467.1 stage II sporulation protein R [Paenibacillus thermoaerophilus]